MKQLLQRLDTGATSLVEVPVPAVGGPHVLVESRATVVSAGTERMLVEFGKANVIEKARQQPDKVKQVLTKMRTDGVGQTLDAVRAKLAAPIPLGYCHAGVVVATGPDARGFQRGDRVVTNGPHADYVRVPVTLAAKIPDEVSYESAAFTPLAAIALQGIRLVEPTLGETVVVYGLGLIGLLAVQLLRANGCRVIGIDRSPDRMAMAETFGATVIEGDGAVADRVLGMTGGLGADAVLLTLATTSHDPTHQAALMSRKRGRIVLVGVAGLNLSRDDFYRKELSFAVSCSYGPGRYDPLFEDQGQDYPLPYVRWTEQRNFEAVLSLMADGRVDPSPLISHTFQFTDAESAYRLLSSDEPSLGIVLQYPNRAGVLKPSARLIERLPPQRSRPVDGLPRVGVIGAGNYGSRVLLPLISSSGMKVRTVASGAGISAAIAADQVDAERVTTDVDEVFGDKSLDSVFILTRHDTHARMAVRALEAGKHVFVEKPLALTFAELEEIRRVAARSPTLLTVGFNRRFAPLTVEVKRHLDGRGGPVTIIATINAGAIPADHWTQDLQVGGRRILGEGVHWIDLMRHLTGAAITGIEVTPARDRTGNPIDDVSHVAISFADGSTGVLHYIATGAKSFPKERIECLFDGKTLVIDNWRRLRRYGVPGPFFDRARKMDKGQKALIVAWRNALHTGEPPIPADEVFEVSHWAIVAAMKARGAFPVEG